MSTRSTTTTTPSRAASVTGDASDSVKSLVSKSKWMLAFLIVTSLLAAFSFVYVCCDWSKSHKDSKSKSAEQQQQQLMSNVAPARFRASGGGGGGGAFYPSPFLPHGGGGGAAGPTFHDRLEKQPAALAAPFPRYLYNPDQGHDTFQRASQPRRHQYHDDESAPRPPQQQQQQPQEVSPPPPSRPLPEQQQQPHGGDGSSAAALPTMPSLSDGARFTLFA